MRSLTAVAFALAGFLLRGAAGAEGPPPKLAPLRHPLTAAEASTLLNAQVKTLEGKVPAAHQKRAANDVAQLVHRLGSPGTEASAVVSRGKVVGVEIHSRRGDARSGAVVSRVTWPVDDSFRMHQLVDGVTAGGFTIRTLSESDAARLRAAEPAATELQGPLVLHVERTPALGRAMGAGPDHRRLSALEATDGRRLVLTPPTKPESRPSPEAPLPARAPIVLDARGRARALAMMVEGATKMSRTAEAPEATRSFVKPSEVEAPRVAANIQAASRYVLEHHADLPLTLETAEKLHGMLTAGIEERYPPRPQWRHALEASFRWLGTPDGRALEKADPVAFAERVHFFLVRTDTLDGGNGRTGRLLADLVLLRNGMAPARYLDRKEHFAATGPQELYPELTEAKRVEYFRQRVAAGEAFLEAQ